MSSSRPPIERDEVVEILYSLIDKYDGHHDRQLVKANIRKSEPFVKLVDYVNKHYTENDFITSCMV